MSGEKEETDKKPGFWKIAGFAMQSFSQSDPVIKEILKAKSKACGANPDRDLGFVKSFQVTKAVFKNPKDTSWMDQQDLDDAECIKKAENETNALFRASVIDLEYCKEVCLQKFPSMAQIISRTHCKRTCEHDFKNQCRSIASNYFIEYDLNGKKREQTEPRARET